MPKLKYIQVLMSSTGTATFPQFSNDIISNICTSMIVWCLLSSVCCAIFKLNLKIWQFVFLTVFITVNCRFLYDKFFFNIVTLFYMFYVSIKSVIYSQKFLYLLFILISFYVKLLLFYIKTFSVKLSYICWSIYIYLDTSYRYATICVNSSKNVLVV